MSWLIDNWMVVGVVLVSVVGTASMAAKLIAPLTKTKVDDKLYGVLSKLHSVLLKLGLK